MTAFALDPQLAADTWPVDEWALSSVRLMDDIRFPWLILVPRVAGATQIHRLAPRERATLLDEVVRASAALEKTGHAHVNVAALGNVVRQLHVHVVARSPGDAAWPGPVFGVPGRQSYTESDARSAIERLRSAFA